MPREWNRVSATQLKVAQLCPRKWWYERISDLPAPPPTAAMLEGKQIHEQVEAWLKEGTAPIDHRATALAKHYPARLAAGGMVHSEIEVNLTAGLPVPLLGFVDLLDARGLPQTVEVVDFKTTSAWKYAKTKEELQVDMQMVPYAVWVMDRYSPKAVTVRHLAVHKTTCVTASTAAVLPPASILRTWSETIVPLAHQMAGWATADGPHSVPTTPSACSAFGGCPFASVCDRGKPAAAAAAKNVFGFMSRIKSSTVPQSTGVTPMSKLQELIRARSLAAGSNTPPPGPFRPPPLHVSPTSSSQEEAELRVQEARARLAKAEAGVVDELPKEPGLLHAVQAAKELRPPADAGYPAATELIRAATLTRDFITGKELRLMVGQATGLRRVAWNHVEECVLEIEGWTLTVDGLERDELTWETPAAVVEAAPVEAPAEAPVEAPVVEAAPESLPEHVKTYPLSGFIEDAAPDAVNPPTTSRGFILLVDVGVVQGLPGWTSQTLEAYLAPIIARYEASTGGPAFLRDFRAGERTVAHMASLDLPADGTLLLVDSGNSVWKELSQALVPRAACILRGTR
jgi:CRISPR/Cas system-associated exonuclease Cas4 (RecB family)